MDTKNLEQVDLRIKSVIDIIAEYRNSADWTKHEFGEFWCSDPIPCTDADIVLFCNKLLAGEQIVSIIVSDVEVVEWGGCVGDETYPVTLTATRLPDGRYFLELSGKNIDKQYIYKVG